MAQTVFKYQEDIDSIITTMADQELIKNRFDLGNGYSRGDYKKLKILKRVLKTADEDLDLQTVKDTINKLQIRYQ